MRPIQFVTARAGLSVTNVGGGSVTMETRLPHYRFIAANNEYVTVTRN